MEVDTETPELFTAFNDASMEIATLSSLQQDILEDLTETKMQLDFERVANEAKMATQEAISKSTIKAYKNHFASFTKFVERCVGNEKSKELNPPGADVPQWIAMWIFTECDIPSPDRPFCLNKSYSTALKMRAAVSWHYNEMGRGATPFAMCKDGSWIGNPSLSHPVSKYMLSLQRRKVRAGEISTSVRSVTSDMLKKLYDINHSFPIYRIGEAPLSESHWGGGRLRLMLQCIYSIAFLCLLRFDEVLKIQAHHIEVISEVEGHIKLTLPFRKTHKFGEIKPFHLYHNSDEPHLDAVHALLCWIKEARIEDGFIFRKVLADDRVNVLENKALGQDTFIDYFRCNLLDIGIDPRPYGTHSFRRGGTQFFSSEKRWTLRRLCDWGGWSMEYDNMTIVRYLFSWNDDPTMPREDFLNPKKQYGRFCGYCGRKCLCS